MNLAQNAAANIREIRRRRGWTKTELGERAGLRRDRVHEIERYSRGLRVVELEALARALKVAPAALLRPVTDPAFPAEETVEISGRRLVSASMAAGPFADCGAVE